MRQCSRCGERVVKTLAERVHRCHNCELVLDRDHNAALNILRLGETLQGNLQNVPSMTPCANSVRHS